MENNCCCALFVALCILCVLCMLLILCFARHCCCKSKEKYSKEYVSAVKETYKLKLEKVKNNNQETNKEFDDIFNNIGNETMAKDEFDNLCIKIETLLINGK